MAVLALTITAAAPKNSADQICPGQKKDGCAVNKVDLAFIIDRSGSLDVSRRGQAYNVQIDGIASALRDPSVIPRDGSVAVAVVEFAEVASVFLPLKEIKSFTDAEDIAASVESLKCLDPLSPTGACPTFGLIPASSYSSGITVANNHLQANKRDGARRVMLLSSDGEPSDFEKAKEASEKARLGAATQGIPSELDVILIGLKAGTTEFSTNKDRVEMIVFPKPESLLPGAVLFVEAGDSAKTAGSRDDPEFVRQINAFAEETRRAIRSKTSTLEFVVTTTADTSFDEPIASGAVSLRQAIEQANCLGGSATITFADNVKDKTISPFAPLPALCAPDITIDGLGGKPVTIDGSKTDITIGEEHGYGILIRSNRDTVRGLRIINFEKAGIAVDPACPLDNVGSNLIGLNTFENNKEAGVMILDPRPGEKSAVDHNVGNRISMNRVSGSRTLIDLGGEGSTPNDPGDLDEGPNRLLNFPEDFLATPNGSAVTISGKAAPNGVVEIFEVTRLGGPSSDPVAAEVIFLKDATTDGNGAFSATAVPISSTGFYVATFTDAAADATCANSSEFSELFCTGSAVAKITPQGGGDFLDFPQIDAPDKAEKSVANSRTFTIENTGCQPLKIRFDSLTRMVTDATIPRKLGSLDDTTFFSVFIIDKGVDDKDVEVAFKQSGEIVIERGSDNARTFRVYFHPIIPARSFTDKAKSLSAVDVLPANFKSMLTFRHDGSGDHSVTLKAHVNNGFKLIDSSGNSSKPQVLFALSGSKASVTFYIYDSGRNVDRAEFKFLDSNGKAVPLDKSSVSLRETIEANGVVRGQSFEVIQRFTSARLLAKVCKVQLTVFDNGNREAKAESAPSCKGGAAVRLKSRKKR